MSAAEQTRRASGAAAWVGRFHGMLGRLVLLAVALLLVGQVALAWLAVRGFERELEPQLSQKAHAVGISVADRFKFAVDDLGIPPRDLVGVGPFFDKILDANSDIEYLILLDPDAEVLFARGLSSGALGRVLPGLPGAAAAPGKRAEVAGFINGAFPVATGDGVVMALHVGTSKKYVRGRLSEILFEVITVIVISWLVTLEFLVFFLNTRVSDPMKLVSGAIREGARGRFADRFALRARDEIGEIVGGFNRMLRDLGKRYEDFRFEVREVRDAQIDERIARRIQAVRDEVDGRYRFTGGARLLPRSAVQVRIPLFLFIFSEELSRSFLPLFVARLSPLGAPVPDELLIGLPITLFMLVVAMVTPFGGALADRLGARRVFLIGIAFAVIAYVGTFFVRGYYDLLLWRGLAGVGYGLLHIAAQVWVTDNSGEDNRARGMAVFAGAVFVGAICGPPIGGIIAARIGFEATFLISAAVSMISGLIVYQVLNEEQRPRAPRRKAVGARAWRILLTDRRFLAVTVLAAVPAKMVLTGFLFYLVPLYLSDLGNSQASIGWVVMLYGVAAVGCTSLAARYADHSRRYAVMVLAGGVLPGLGCSMALFQGALGAVASVVIAVLSLGVGHAFGLTSQLTIAQKVADAYSDTMGRATVIAAFRLIERAGLVLGPIIAGALVAGFGYQGAIVGIGLIMLGCIAVYGAVTGLSEEGFKPSPGAPA